MAKKKTSNSQAPEQARPRVFKPKLTDDELRLIHMAAALSDLRIGVWVRHLMLSEASKVKGTLHNIQTK